MTLITESNKRSLKVVVVEAEEGLTTIKVTAQDIQQLPEVEIDQDALSLLAKRKANYYVSGYQLFNIFKNEMSDYLKSFIKVADNEN